MRVSRGFLVNKRFQCPLHNTGHHTLIESLLSNCCTDTSMLPSSLHYHNVMKADILLIGMTQPLFPTTTASRTSRPAFLTGRTAASKTTSRQSRRACARPCSRKGSGNLSTGGFCTAGLHPAPVSLKWRSPLPVSSYAEWQTAQLTVDREATATIALVPTRAPVRKATPSLKHGRHTGAALSCGTGRHRPCQRRPPPTSPSSCPRRNSPRGD